MAGLVKDLVRPITGREGGSGVSNTISFNSYIDDIVEDGDIVWVHTVPTVCKINDMASGSVALLGGAINATISVTLNGTEIGTITFEPSSVLGTFNFTGETILVKGDALGIVATSIAGGSNLSVSLLGMIL
ncbi:hypothetical protein NVP1262O_18 [Vibrio phage 1.262.O._10N.286.51.A9]|nr:hypothetical protein NVP1262O_18 [Vibrio phage 1.262.O._10N.286.51.A9]